MRWVIKIGSGVLAGDDGRLREPVLQAIARDVADLRARGLDVIVVSSGAVASGFRLLGFDKPPSAIRERQACAAVGQVALVRAYDQVFRTAIEGHPAVAGLVLLTHDDFDNRLRYLHGRHTIETLLERGAIPVVNENDTVAVEEILLGDNDRLGAMVAAMVDADRYVILTNVDGYLENVESGAQTVVPTIAEGDLDRYMKAVGIAKSALGRGGMRSKLEAAKAATSFGIPTTIASGQRPSVLLELLAGAAVGTSVEPATKPLNSRRYWIRFVTKPKGRIVVDAGAVTAICAKGKSLLPKGILAVAGKFAAGDPVQIETQSGDIIARGLVEYTQADLEKIKGLHSSQIEAALGYKGAEEAVHRDDLVLESALLQSI